MTDDAEADADRLHEQVKRVPARMIGWGAVE
jgi:hypothetical protein